MIKKFISLSPIFIFILAIINNKIIYDGTLAGIKLILFTVIPTLFPFILISDIMIALNTTDKISFLLNPLTRILHLSSPCGYAIITGFLCGYPIGAKSCADLVKSGRISESEGNYMLSFVNNASPAFLSSYIAVSLLHGMINPAYIFLVCYASAFITALIICPFYRKASSVSASNVTGTAPANQDSITYFSIDKTFLSSVRTLIRISSYILLFSILCEFLKYFSDIIPKILLSGLFEITTGTYFISICTIPFSTKLLLIIFFTMFGGLSAMFQTYSMISDSNLSLKWYVAGKITAALVSLPLTIIFIC